MAFLGRLRVAGALVLTLVGCSVTPDLEFAEGGVDAGALLDARGADVAVGRDTSVPDPGADSAAGDASDSAANGGCGLVPGAGGALCCGAMPCYGMKCSDPTKCAECLATCAPGQVCCAKGGGKPSCESSPSGC